MRRFPIGGMIVSATASICARTTASQAPSKEAAPTRQPPSSVPMLAAAQRPSIIDVKPVKKVQIAMSGRGIKTMVVPSA